MISERLKEVRLLLGYGNNQKEFAEKLDMKQGSYSDVERGKTKSISKKMIRNLYVKFGVNQDYLLNGSLPILITEKKENLQYNSTAQQLNQFLTAIEAKDEQIKELLMQQKELLCQQKKLIAAINSLSKTKEKSV